MFPQIVVNKDLLYKLDTIKEIVEQLLVPKSYIMILLDYTINIPLGVT